MTENEAIAILWDYMRLNQEPRKADCILGLGCYNEDVARRAAELYHAGFAPLVMFTGALGRNTSSMWSESEAQRFGRIAMEAGVPEEAILLEDRATNTGENLIFSRQLLADRGITHPKLLVVQKPYMERRIAAAFPVYWPEADMVITSPQLSMEEYFERVKVWGRSREDTIHMIVGDFQRISLYAEKGYQIPQEIPDSVQAAFEALVEMGYTKQLIK